MVSGQEFLAHGRRPPGHVLTQARMKLQALSVPSRPPTPSQGTSLVTPSNPDHIQKSCQYHNTEGWGFSLCMWRDTDLQPATAPPRPPGMTDPLDISASNAKQPHGLEWLDQLSASCPQVHEKVQ